MSVLINGTTLKNGKYTIVQKIGQGSFGITYLATTRMSLNGQLGVLDVDVNVTIKEFFMSGMCTRSDDGTSVERTDSSLVINYKHKFTREAENLSHLHHDNIVKVLEVFEENNTVYYVMEYIDGGSVDDLIKVNGRLTTGQTVDIAHQVCTALQYMHNNRMVHLDLKPKNIMLTSTGKVKLIDFGLSKQYNDNGEPESSTSIGLGTPGYAPLEQATYRQDNTLPVTIDVYALGATMYKMLTGAIPPEASYILNDENIVRNSLIRAGISNELLNFVCKAMDPKKINRFQSMSEMDRQLYNLGSQSESKHIHQFHSTEVTHHTPSYTNKAKTGSPPPPYQPLTNGPTTNSEGFYPPKFPDSTPGKTPEQKSSKKWIIIAIAFAAVLLAIILLLTLGKGSKKRSSFIDTENETAMDWPTKKASAQTIALPTDLSDLVDYAREEGENWSVDDWKAAFRAALEDSRPLLLELIELQKMNEDDPSKAEQYIAENEDLQERAEEMGSLMDELSDIAEATENGKIVSNDDEFAEEVLKDLGLEDLDL